MLKSTIITSHWSPAMLARFVSFLFLSLANCGSLHLPFMNKAPALKQSSGISIHIGVCSKHEVQNIRRAMYTASIYVDWALREIDGNPRGGLFKYFFDTDSIASVRSVFSAVNATLNYEDNEEMLVQVRCDDILKICQYSPEEELQTYLSEDSSIGRYINLCHSLFKLPLRPSQCRAPFLFDTKWLADSDISTIFLGEIIRYKSVIEGSVTIDVNAQTPEECNELVTTYFQTPEADPLRNVDSYLFFAKEAWRSHNSYRIRAKWELGACRNEVVPGYMERSQHNEFRKLLRSSELDDRDNNDDDND